MINTLQAGRFMAAMAVVLHHAVISVAAFVETPPWFVYSLLEYGYLGVDFFFVLSGFIIHYTMSLKPRPAPQFALDRLGRILLPYWPVGVALAVAYTLLPALSDSGRSWSWLSTLTLIPTEAPPALSVAWTLQHELVFYLIYATLFFTSQISSGLALWGLAIILGPIWLAPELPVLKIALAPIDLEFIAGVAAASFFLSKHKTSTAWSVSLSSLFLFAFLVLGADRDESALIGLSIASLLPCLCRFEEAGRFFVPSWLVFGGAASYAIYLTHNPLLSLTSRAFGLLGSEWLIAIIASVIVCTFVGVLYYATFERPIMQIYKRIQNNSLSLRM